MLAFKLPVFRIMIEFGPYMYRYIGIGRPGGLGGVFHHLFGECDVCACFYVFWFPVLWEVQS